MITLNEKQKIILYYTKDNMSQREISRRTGVARDTIRKYIREYESKVQELGYALSDIEKADLIEEITKKPKYKSSPRTKTAVTDEVKSLKCRLHFCQSEIAYKLRYTQFLARFQYRITFA